MYFLLKISKTLGWKFFSILENLSLIAYKVSAYKKLSVFHFGHSVLVCM